MNTDKATVDKNVEESKDLLNGTKKYIKETYTETNQSMDFER